MDIIKAVKLVHEYIRRDEEGNVESIQTALDQVDLNIQEGEFIRSEERRVGKEC